MTDCCSPDATHASLQTGFELIDEAQSGSRRAAALAREEFGRLLASGPDCAMARVHWGLAMVLEARDEPPAKGLALAKQGFAEMDAAVASAPGHPRVRLVRAVNAYHMPLALGRRDIAADDFEWLVDRSRHGSAIGDPLRRSILFHAGAFALKERRREAVSLLLDALAVPANLPADDQVQSMLALAHQQFTPPEHAQAKDQKKASPP